MKFGDALSELEGRPVRGLVRLHVTAILVPGVVLSSILLVVSLCALINQVIWVSFIKRKSGAYDAVEAFASITDLLWTELELRVRHSGTPEDVTTVHKEWTSALLAMESSMSVQNADFVRMCIALFSAAVSRGDLLHSYVRLLTAITSAFYLLLRDTYEARAQATADSLVLFSTQAGLGSLMSRNIFLRGKESSFPVTADAANGLLIQQVTAYLSPYMFPKAALMAESYSPFIVESSMMTAAICGFQTSTDIIEFSPSEGLHNFEAVLGEAANDNVQLSRREADPLFFFIVGAVLILIALILCGIVFCCYCIRSKQARTLASAFEDPKSKSHLRRKYLPALVELRAVGDAKHRSNEVNRVYSIAACWMDVLRTLTPQLLFGSYPDRSRDWSLLEQEVHLSVGKTRVCRDTVIMEVSISVHADEQRPFYERELSEQLELLNELYRIVVSETNAAGGVVLGLRGNVSVLCAWNTTWVARRPAWQALEAAHRIQYRLQGVPGIPRVLIAIASGTAVVGSFGACGRHYAGATSAALCSLEAMRVTGNAMGCTMVMDRNTTRHLPRRVSRLLKPLVVLRLRTRVGFVSFVMYAGDDVGMEVQKQRLQYVKCFSLYQNNLLNESNLAFERYVARYPEDVHARWVYEVLFRPKYWLCVKDTGKSRGEEEISSSEGGDVGVAVLPNFTV